MRNLLRDIYSLALSGEGEAASRVGQRLWLIAILCLGLALRIYGIGWGLPHRTDMHPDEHDYVLAHALQVSLEHPDPVFLNYPSFLMYLISLTFGGLTRLGLISGVEWQAYLIGRLWVAGFSALTVWPAARIVRELGGSYRSALLAALFVALLPLSVWEAHVAVTDSLMTFWVVMTLWCSVRLVRTGLFRDYAAAGACLGLATGSKYTAALTVVALLAGALASRRPVRSVFKGLLVAGLVSLACAFAVAPFSFLRIHDLLAAMQYEHHHVDSHHYGFSLPANGWQYRRYLYQFVAAWPFSFGFALYAVALLGMIRAVRKADRRMLPLLAFGLVFFGLTGSWTFTPIRYYLPLVVLGALWAGLWMGEVLENARFRRVGWVVLVAVLGYTSLFTYQTTARFAHETRDEAGHWLDANLRRGGTLVLGGWFRYLALPTDPFKYTIHFKGMEKEITGLPDDTDCDLIEISSLVYLRHKRHGNTDMIGFYKHLRKPSGPFELVARFDSSFINKRLYMKLDPMFGGYFVSPTLEFYHAKHPHPREPMPKAHG